MAIPGMASATDWRGPEQAGEALRAQDVPDHGKGRYERAPHDESDDILAHFAFFHIFESGPLLP
jgi:hypothetical protein